MQTKVVACKRLTMSTNNAAMSGSLGIKGRQGLEFSNFKTEVV